jgi:hypothetical protein
MTSWTSARLARDAVEPDPDCAHYAMLTLWPWDPEVDRLRAIAERRGVDLQARCNACRRWVRFDAWPPYPDGVATRYGEKIPRAS